MSSNVDYVICFLFFLDVSICSMYFIYIFFNKKFLRNLNMFCFIKVLKSYFLFNGIHTFFFNKKFSFKTLKIKLLKFKYKKIVKRHIKVEKPFEIISQRYLVIHSFNGHKLISLSRKIYK